MELSDPLLINYICTIVLVNKRKSREKSQLYVDGYHVPDDLKCDHSYNCSGRDMTNYTDMQDKNYMFYMWFVKIRFAYSC